MVVFKILNKCFICLIKFNTLLIEYNLEFIAEYSYIMSVGVLSIIFKSIIVLNLFMDQMPLIFKFVIAFNLTFK